MSFQTKRLLTADDYRSTPDGPPWLQLIEGELVQEPSPNLGHQKASVNLVVQLATHAKKGKLGTVLAAPMDVWLSAHNVFQPDLIFVSNERAGLLAEDGIHGAPDLVVEILSPSSLVRDSMQKRRVYASAGVCEYWIVDPERREVRIYRFNEDQAKPVAIARERDTIRTLLLPGLEIGVRSIF